MTSFADEYGQVAATYLAREYTPGELDTISALISGIRDPELCTELIEAELAIGPREGVIAELNQRKALLEEHEHLRQPIEELGRRDVPDPVELPPRDVRFLDENGEEYERGTSATAKLSALRAEQREPELAADGGESSGDGANPGERSRIDAPPTDDRDDRDADDLEGST